MRPRILEYLSAHGISLYIPDYNAVYLFTIILVILLSTYSATKKSYSAFKFLGLTLLVVLFSVAGARIYAVILDILQFHYFPSLKEIVTTHKTGSFGFYFGGFFGVLLISSYFKFDKKKVLDIYAPFLALSLVLGRTGCFLSGCCYGKISNVPWAISFPPPSLVFQKQRLAGLVTPFDNSSLPVHPTQLYEAFVGLVLFIILLILKKRIKINGIQILLFFLVYSFFRFFIEFFRADNFPFLGILSLPQFLSIIIFLISLAYFIHFLLENSRNAVYDPC